MKYIEKLQITFFLSRSKRITYFNIGWTSINKSCIKYGCLMMMINCFVEWLIDKRRLILFPAGTIVRESHHSKSLTYGVQDLDLRRTRVQASLNKITQH